MTISRKTKRDLHAFDADGMVLCNPRDREAAHRAQAEGIATDVREDVTCPNCIPRLFKLEKSRRERKDRSRLDRFGSGKSFWQ